MNRTIVVVTRIGARLSAGSPVPSEELTDTHLTIASRVAATSLAGMDLPHHWVVVTSPERSEQVAKVVMDWPERAPRPLVHVQGTPEVERRAVPGEHFLTVRLDADDAWLPAVFNRLGEIEVAPGQALHFPNGWQIDMVGGRACALSYSQHWTSPYLAIANEGRDSMLDLHEPHTSISKTHRVIERREPGWVQLVGHWNASNHFDRFGRGNLWPVKTVLADAGLDFTDLAWEGELDELAARHGSDKGSTPGRGLFPKRYAPIYQRLLAPLRERACQIVEYGVYNGGSIRMWLDFLPTAHVVGVDLRAAPRSLTTQQRYVHVQGNQVSPATRDRVLQACRGDIDAIIDDCSHRTEDHRATHELLWPHLRSGGFYAIEDLHATPASVPWLEDLGAQFHCDGRLALLTKP